ncbi:MAG: excinuclease ATPase subunit [Ottowia sp.]|nr:excinuclease ATPase subunit [Ottowia sp.]
MKKLLIAALVVAAAGMAQARDDKMMLPLADVVKLGMENGKLDGSVKFYMSGAKTPAVKARYGEDVANKKTNGFKDATAACQWAALSALIAFQQSAKQRGANAVVNLHSFYKRNTTKHPTNYECHEGTFVTGVTLKGTYARVGR